MKVVIDRDALLSAVRQVIDVVPGRTTIPILANIMIEADGANARLTATDLDLQATSEVEASGIISTSVAGDKLLAAVSSLAPGKLTIEQARERGSITVKAGRAVRTLATLPCDDFPKRKLLENAVSFSIPARGLGRLIETTRIAHCTEETRYYLQGGYFHVVNDLLRVAATDGHRLVRAETRAPEGASDLRPCIVGTKVIALMIKLLAKYEGDVALSFTDRAIEARLGPVLINASLVDGTYPDYTRVIPPVGEHQIAIARDALITPAKAVAAVIDAEGDKQKVRSIRIDLVDGDGHEISSADKSGSSAREPLDCQVEGGPFVFGVNSQYLAATCGIFSETGKLTLTMADASAPMLIKSDKDADLLVVIMPMRV